MRMYKGSLSIIGFAALLCGSSITSAQSLGTAQNFAVLGGSAITNTGPSVISGDVGVSPSTALSGFPPGIVVGGGYHAGDAAAAQAQVDLTTAYNAVAGTACTTDLTGQDLGGMTLTPGVYCFSSSAALTGTLTLNMLGNPSAQFLFQIDSSLITASGSTVVLQNSGGSTCPENLFWQVGSSATFGTGSTFIGNVLSLTSITLTTGTNLTGRALARNGAVTLDSNTVTRCGELLTCPTITIDPATLPAGSVGVLYDQTISASGGASPYTFFVTSGMLPNGLTLNSSTGRITGTPLAAGSFSFTVAATDSNGCSGLRDYTIVVNSFSPAIPLLDNLGLGLMMLSLVGAAFLVMNRLTF